LTLGVAMIVIPSPASAQLSVSITLEPPALPVYEQPALVEVGSIWAPGYWDYDQDTGYFWVPGTWVQPPEAGLLWTPGYWGWGNGGYAWNAGYWGATVGFYGGIAYGFGYTGEGYAGGHWQGKQFYYNTAVSNVSVANIHNTYTQTVVNNTTNRVSFNGGTGGTTARPTAAQQAAASAPHQPATAVQMQHRQAAMGNQSLRASVNNGKPPVAATAKPGELSGTGIVKASAAGSPVKTSRTMEAAPKKASAASSPQNASRTMEAAPAAKRAPAAVHAADLPAVAHQPVKSTGNAERDQANQRERDDLSDKQESERQDLQKQQAADHERVATQSASSANAKALEQQHQAQTKALAQRHVTEQKTLQKAQATKPQSKNDTASRN
jgi:hypothetical protein